MLGSGQWPWLEVPLPRQKYIVLDNFGIEVKPCCTTYGEYFILLTMLITKAFSEYCENDNDE